MNRESIFETWAPDHIFWSRWAKPVLFAHVDSAALQNSVPELPPEIDWAPSPKERTALVLDLPGPQGVSVGVALAARGYRPVPLYNAVPLPFGEPFFVPFGSKLLAAVDVLPILGALRNGADQLSRLSLAADAPPAFLLDSNRQGDGRQIEPEEFDNRSISFATDFPSANLLASQGIQQILLVQNHSMAPQSDLAHTLRRWQDGGFQIHALNLGSATPAQLLHISRPSWFGAMFQRALASMGLRRASGGGFGAWMPSSSG